MKQKPKRVGWTRSRRKRTLAAKQVVNQVKRDIKALPPIVTAYLVEANRVVRLRLVTAYVPVSGDE